MKMISFFTMAAIILGGMHIYLFLRLRQLFGGGFWQIPVIAFFTVMVALLAFRRQILMGEGPEWTIWAAYTWMGFMVVVTMLFLSADAVRIILWLVRLLSGKNLLPVLAYRHMTPILLALAVSVSAYGIYSARNIQVRHVTIKTPKLAPGSGELRMALLTDVHLSPTIGPKMLSNMVSLSNGQNPDIVIIAGDLVDTDMAAKTQEAELLRSLRAPMGKFAVLGNHEAYRGLLNSRSFIARSGLTPLENQSVELGGITVIGIDDPQVMGMTGNYADVPKMLNEANRDDFILLVKHRPMFDDEEVGLFDLQLSGHTHGGQIWPVGLLAAAVNNSRQGLSELKGENGESLIYVSNGTGYWGPPMRVLTDPEVTVFHIQPE